MQMISLGDALHSAPKAKTLLAMPLITTVIPLARGLHPATISKIFQHKHVSSIALQTPQPSRITPPIAAFKRVPALVFQWYHPEPANHHAQTTFIKTKSAGLAFQPVQLTPSIRFIMQPIVLLLNVLLFVQEICWQTLQLSHVFRAYAHHCLLYLPITTHVYLSLIHI